VVNLLTLTIVYFALHASYLFAKFLGLISNKGFSLKTFESNPTSGKPFKFWLLTMKKIVVISPVVEYALAGTRAQFIFPSLVLFAIADVIRFLGVKELGANYYYHKNYEPYKKLIKSGIYSVVRHPLYLSGAIVAIASPLFFGVVFSWFFTVFYILLLLVRIKNEEKLMLEKLRGYAAYKKQVPYNFIPKVW